MVYFTELFGIDESVLEDYGAINISLLNDKISSVDFNVLKDYINTVDFELKQKMETMFNECMNITNTNMENLNKEMLLNINNNKSQINSLLN